MLRTVLAAALAVAVGCSEVDPVTDPDLHREVTCAAGWTQWHPDNTGCETPCASPPPSYIPNYVPPDGAVTCLGAYPHPNGGPPFTVPCFGGTVFEYDGIDGCCSVYSSAKGDSIHFAVCTEVE